MSRISRLKTPLIILGIFIVAVAVAAVAVNVFVFQPRNTQAGDYAKAKAGLASAMAGNNTAQKAFTAELSAVRALQAAVTTLPSAPKALFTAADLEAFSTDTRTLNQAAAATTPGPATDLPTGQVSYAVASNALNRAAAGVRDNTTLAKTNTSQLRTVVNTVTSDLRTAAATVSDQSQTVLVSSQGASNSLQTAFATASDIDTTGSGVTIANALNAYVTAGQQVIDDNKAHPVKPKPIVIASPSPTPTPTATPSTSPTPKPGPTAAPTPSPSVPPTPAPVDHTPRVVANGDYQATCTASTALFTQETKAGNTITLNEAFAYTYTTYSTPAGFGVKVSSCTTS